jgi:hypothetical protein
VSIPAAHGAPIAQVRKTQRNARVHSQVHQVRRPDLVLSSLESARSADARDRSVVRKQQCIIVPSPGQDVDDFDEARSDLVEDQIVRVDTPPDAVMFNECLSGAGAATIGEMLMKAKTRTKARGTPSFATAVGRALRSAAKDAQRTARMYGTPLYFCENGKVVAKKP